MFNLKKLCWLNLCKLSKQKPILKINFFTINPKHCSDLTTSFEKSKNLMETSLSEKNSYSQKKFNQVAELFKVANSKFDYIDLEFFINLLTLCSQYKNYPEDLLPKIEKKLCHTLARMNEEQIAKCMKSIFKLEFKTASIKFAIERALTKNLMTFQTKNFVQIIKSSSQCLNFKFSSSLNNLIKNYIDKNLNKFTIEEACDIVLVYPKMVYKIPSPEEISLYHKAFNQIYSHYQKLDLNRIVKLFNLLYCEKTIGTPLEFFYKDIEIHSDENFWNIFYLKENEIDNMMIYSLILTLHFPNNILKKSNQQNWKEKLDFLNKSILSNIKMFTPNEINSIITIISKNKIFSKNQESFEKIIQEFLDVTKSDYNLMALNELIQYMQSYLILVEEKLIHNELIISNIKNILSILQQDFMKKVSSIDLLQAASIFELIHHFKSRVNISEYFNEINIDIIAEKINILLSLSLKEDLSVIFDDYYIIFLFLSDMNYKNKDFWIEFIKYKKVFEQDENFIKLKEQNNYISLKLAKLQIMVELVNNHLIL
jgi:hypothetical protein